MVVGVLIRIDSFWNRHFDADVMALTIYAEKFDAQGRDFQTNVAFDT